MALAMSEIIFTTPLAVFTLYLNMVMSPVAPWISWADTHYEYFRIRQIPAILWRSDHTHVIALEFTRWVAPLCAFVFFAFFGFADEARKNYSKLFLWIFRPFGFQSQRRQLHSTKDTASLGFENFLQDILSFLIFLLGSLSCRSHRCRINHVIHLQVSFQPIHPLPPRSTLYSILKTLIQWNLRMHPINYDSHQRRRRQIPNLVWMHRL